MPLGHRPVYMDAATPIYITGNAATDAEGNPIVFNTIDTWRIELLSDILLNNSDKTFVVPANTEYQILTIWVEFTTTAVAGDRQLVVEVQDVATDIILQAARAGVVQPESLTRYYLFGPSIADLTGFRDTDYLTTPIPVLYLEEDDILRIYDNNAVDAAADDMIVYITLGSREI